MAKPAQQIAVVTGSSRGIGRAIALELAASGADLVLHARTENADVLSVAEEVRQLDRQATIIPAELSDVGAQDGLIKEALAVHGCFDVWVNNAGVDVLTGPVAAESFEEKLERLWRVDVMATMRLSRMAGQAMKQASAGCLINIGWDQADYGMAGDSGEMFAAIKSAVMAFTRSLARSLAPSVRVNCVAPGWIKTDWGEQASECWHARAVGESLLARWGTPEDVARTVRWLASAEASFVNGQTIAVNGGFATGFEPRMDTNR